MTKQPLKNGNSSTAKSADSKCKRHEWLPIKPAGNSEDIGLIKK